MIVRVGLSAFHVLALALGLGAVLARGMRLRELAVRQRMPARSSGSFWRTASGARRRCSGSGRASGGFSASLEKTPDFYLRNGFFWVKMALFGLVLALEILPMLTFIRWRAARSRGNASVAGANFATLIALSDAEVAIVVLIPFVAALMARGAWLF